jgi:integrase/recombinase XerC
MDELATDADILDDAAALALSAHILRHTLATNLLRAGVDIVVAAELLGHTRLDTTRRYTCLPTPTSKTPSAISPPISRTTAELGELNRVYLAARVLPTHDGVEEQRDSAENDHCWSESQISTFATARPRVLVQP